MNKRKINVKDYGILIFFFMLFIVLALTARNFFSAGNILNVLRQVSVTGIVAVGETMAILTSGIDLSIGSTLAASGVLTAYAMINWGFSPILASLLGIGVGLIIGILNGLLITKVKIPPLITTLATMTGARGVCYIITRGIPIYGFPESFKFIGQGHIFGLIPVPVVIMICVFIIGWIVIRKLPIGRYIFGIGGNEDAVKLAGINVNNVKQFVYGFSGLLSGFAGVVYLSRVNSAMPSNATGFEMDVITAVVLGGVSISGGEGRLSGVIIGVLIVGFLLNGLIILGIPEYYQYIVRCVVLLVAVGMDTVYARIDKRTQTVTV